MTPIATFGAVIFFCKTVLGYAISSGTCVDKVACYEYPPEICTDLQYFVWKTENCPAYCGVCSQPTQGTHVGFGKLMDSNTGNVMCKDTLSNCAEYGTKLCSDVKFFNWVNENCKAHCNRCDNKCEDTIPNCSEYGASLCTELSYYNWVELHCRKFCMRCKT